MSEEQFPLEAIERTFAQTRLNPPLLADPLLERLYLLHQLAQAVSTHRLTLISAPAGSGKTTLAASLINRIDTQVAWLTLDRQDNDPVTFLTLITLALRQKSPSLGAAVLDLLGHLPDAHIRLSRLLNLLINDILALDAPACAFVLDDYHLIREQTVHELVAELLDHAPPQLHLVITSRYQPPLPLSKWRMRGQLTEFHLPDRPPTTISIYRSCPPARRAVRLSTPATRSTAD